MHVPEKFLLIPHAVTYEVEYIPEENTYREMVPFSDEGAARDFMETYGGVLWFTVCDSDGAILYETVID